MSLGWVKGKCSERTFVRISFSFTVRVLRLGGLGKTNLINCFNCRCDELSKGDSHVRRLRKLSVIAGLRRGLMCARSSAKVGYSWVGYFKKCKSNC